MVNKTTRNSLVIVFLILGVGFPGLIGISAVQAQVGFDSLSVLRSAYQDGPTPTLTPTAVVPLLPSLTATASLDSLSSVFSPHVDVYAFIQAPSGHVLRPYVILTSFASISQNVLIKGYIDSREFVCADSPCLVYLEDNARIIFRAVTASGGNSSESIAVVSVTSDAQGYLVTVDSVSQFTSFVDSCSLIWGVQDDDVVTWDSFVQFPYQLHTRKTLHTLATQLLVRGVVDASDCPVGGLNSGLTWPTACGLERASSEMIKWQNQFDEYIWLASKDYGIPPKVLKSLIELESQFWPGNSRFYLDEIGLGQINQLGVDVLLRRDPFLYQEICSQVLSDCSEPYVRLKTEDQALIRGAVVKSVDASCPTCAYGVDLDKAKNSIALVANLLRANCQQVDTILGADISDASYDDLWRFTFGTYHSGVSCFQTAVTETRDNGKPITWENLQNELKCGRGPDYVDGLMDNLFVFDQYLDQGLNVDAIRVLPTIIPTQTPIPTPTVYVSSSIVKVRVYIDRNGNLTPEQNEWLDGVSIQLRTTSNQLLETRTASGVAMFDMHGYAPGLGIDVSLPGLYRSENFILPEQGEVMITFRFDQPALPTILP